MVKNPSANAGDLREAGSIPGLGRSSGEGHGNPLQGVFLPGESHGQRRLASYSPWVRKQLNTTKASNLARTHACVYHVTSPELLALERVQRQGKLRAQLPEAKYVHVTSICIISLCIMNLEECSTMQHVPNSFNHLKSRSTGVVVSH